MSYETIIRKNDLIENAGQNGTLQKFKVARSDIHPKLHRTHPGSVSSKHFISDLSEYWYRPIFEYFCLIN